MDGLPLQTAYQRLFIALQKGGYNEIARTAFDIIDKPIIIVNAELNKLAQYPDKTLGDAIWDSYHQKRSMTSEMIWQLIDDSTIMKSEKSDLPVWVDWGLVQEIPRLVGNIRINGAVEGYVGVLFPEKTYTNQDVQLTRLIGQAIGLEMQKGKQLEGSRLAILSGFIHHLFEGQINNPHDLSRWLKSLNTSINPPYCIVVIGKADLDQTSLYVIKNQIENELSKVFCTVNDGKLNFLSTEVMDDKNFTFAMQDRLHRIQTVAEHFHLHYGISEPFSNLLELNTYLDQACQAFQIGQWKYPDLPVHFFRDLALESLYSRLKGNIQSANYIHPSIQVIQKYDQENDTDYLLTLKSYITAFCNPGKTTRLLHIHRNTLLYRLRKIEELANISLEDERTNAWLLSSIYLLESEAFD